MSEQYTGNVMVMARKFHIKVKFLALTKEIVNLKFLNSSYKKYNFDGCPCVVDQQNLM